MSKMLNINGDEISVVDAKTLILAQLDENSKSDEFKALVQAIVRVAGPKRSATSKTSLFRAELVKKQSMTEDEIWSTYRWGKHETLSTCWGFRKKGNPDEFIYVDFNRDINGIGTYSIVGTGAIEPDGYSTRNKKKKEEN